MASYAAAPSALQSIEEYRQFRAHHIDPLSRMLAARPLNQKSHLHLLYEPNLWNLSSRLIDSQPTDNDNNGVFERDELGKGGGG